MERCFNLSRSRSTFSRTLSSPPAPGAQTPKIFLLSASGNVRNLDLRHVTILYTAHPTATPSGNNGVCRPESSPTPPQTRRPRHQSAAPGPRRRLGALSAHIFPKPFSTRRRPHPRPTPAAQGNQQPPSPLGTTPCFDNHPLLCHPERSRGTCGAPLGLPEFQGSHGIGSPPYPVTLFSARRVSRGTRPISSGSCSRHLTNC
jgi:hypothetical protein